MDEKLIRRGIVGERESLLRRLDARLEMPMAMLGLAWLALLIVDLTRGLTPGLSQISGFIWAVFGVDFLIKFVLAPRKTAFLRRHWLTALSLLLPAIRIARLVRVLRFARAARSVRALRMLRLLTSMNRGMRALGATLRRRGAGYVALLTVIVLFAGAAGMYAFESGVQPELADYGSALWWTAMVLVTMGSAAWPVTAEGRLLCLLLAVYGYSVFGYITATLASFFIVSDAPRRD
jgi:voltage-gated potassium channel